MKTNGKKNDNSDNGEKIIIRKRLLAYIDTPSVLECFAGDGKIYRECYQGLPYLGLDIKNIKDGRQIIRMDNRKFLRSADLSKFNVFDLDAYGSPWHQFLIILHRREVFPGERIAIFTTDGLHQKMAMSSLPNGMMQYVGMPPGFSVPCLNRHAQFITDLFVSKAVRLVGLKISKALIAQNKRGNMKYAGLLLSN